MIIFKDLVFDDYFINEDNGEITDLNGNKRNVYLHKGRAEVLIHGKKLSVHQIQAHTYFGFDKDKVIHHIDGNKQNNALSNLVYLTPSEHAKIHNKGRKISKNTRNKIKNTLKEKYKSGEIISPSKGKKGVLSPMYGKKHTEETKHLMSQKTSGEHNQAYRKTLVE